MALRVVDSETTATHPDLSQLWDEAALAIRRLVEAYYVAERELPPEERHGRETKVGGVSTHTWRALESCDNLLGMYRGGVG